MDTTEIYHRWFGILPSEFPTNAYRLLGIELFEEEPEVIGQALQQRRTQLRGYLDGDHGAIARAILNELDQVEACLQNEDHKAVYDQQLRDQMKAKQSFTFNLGGSSETPASSPEMSAAPADLQPRSDSDDLPFLPLPRAVQSPGARRPAGKNPAIETLKIVLGGIAGIVLAYALLSFIKPDNDFFKYLGIKPMFGAPADPQNTKR